MSGYAATGQERARVLQDVLRGVLGAAECVPGIVNGIEVEWSTQPPGGVLRVAQDTLRIKLARHEAGRCVHEEAELRWPIQGNLGDHLRNLLGRMVGQ